MKPLSTRMTVQDLSLILNISEGTVVKLAQTKQLPSLQLNNQIYFILDEVIDHFKKLEGSAA